MHRIERVHYTCKNVDEQGTKWQYKMERNNTMITYISSKEEYYRNAHITPRTESERFTGLISDREPIQCIPMDGKTSNVNFYETEPLKPFREQYMDRVSSAGLSIVRKINIFELIEISAMRISEKINISNQGRSDSIGNMFVVKSNKGEFSLARSSDHKSIAANTGSSSQSKADKNSSIAANTGHKALISTSGIASFSAGTGAGAISQSCGDHSISGVTDFGSASMTTGSYSIAACTAHKSISTSKNNFSCAISTAANSSSICNGYNSVSVCSFNFSDAICTAPGSIAVSAGDSSNATVNASQSIAVVSGYQSRASGVIGSALVICRRDKDYNITHINAAIVDGENLKEGIYYELDKNGDFSECKNKA